MMVFSSLKWTSFLRIMMIAEAVTPLKTLPPKSMISSIEEWSNRYCLMMSLVEVRKMVLGMMNPRRPPGFRSSRERIKKRL